ncbi:hypothetical protein [Streptomyces sp. NBC_01477]|uniref:hypothetical protein n=1 Tax=Streptomyces sp. NBC_01477 TaxID=2976015 RepID=UPI002E37900E|nr:hypothetical protein [Streptomyces sp. NBC_01477]
MITGSFWLLDDNDVVLLFDTRRSDAAPLGVAPVSQRAWHVRLRQRPWMSA